MGLLALHSSQDSSQACRSHILRTCKSPHTILKSLKARPLMRTALSAVNWSSDAWCQERLSKGGTKPVAQGTFRCYLLI